MFKNKQNVHTENVSKFTDEVIQFLINQNPTKKFLNLSEIKKTILLTNSSVQIQTALDRIEIDKTLYTEFNISIKSIFVKLYNFILHHKHKKELLKRLTEELYDMYNLCTSGVISRLCNVLSGFEDFNITIEWEEQIISNIIGRMNAAIKTIDKPDSVYSMYKIYDIVDLWLKRTENIEMRHQLFTDLDTLDNDYVLAVYISQNEERLSEFVSSFKYSVIEEITIPSNDYKNRQNFLLFYKTQINILHQELFDEFKEFISHEDFESYFRKGIIKYEEGSI